MSENIEANKQITKMSKDKNFKGNEEDGKDEVDEGK